MISHMSNNHGYLNSLQKCEMKSGLTTHAMCAFSTSKKLYFLVQASCALQKIQLLHFLCKRVCILPLPFDSKDQLKSDL